VRVLEREIGFERYEGFGGREKNGTFIKH